MLRRIDATVAAKPSVVPFRADDAKRESRLARAPQKTLGYNVAQTGAGTNDGHVELQVDVRTRMNPAAPPPPPARWPLTPSPGGFAPPPAPPTESAPFPPSPPRAEIDPDALIVGASRRIVPPDPPPAPALPMAIGCPGRPSATIVLPTEQTLLLLDARSAIECQVFFSRCTYESGGNT